jgi:hypothetical protein
VLLLLVELEHMSNFRPPHTCLPALLAATTAVCPVDPVGNLGRMCVLGNCIQNVMECFNSLGALQTCVNNERWRVRHRAAWCWSAWQALSLRTPAVSLSG